MGRRTVLLIASILVAAVGTALIFMYVRGADDRANANTERIQVVVASKEIPKGQTVKDSGTSFTLKPIPRDALPENAYYDGGAGLNKLNARVSDSAVRTIPKGTTISPSDFGGVDEVNAAGLGKNQVEIAIQVTDPNRVAASLTPGSRVSIIDTTDPATKKELGIQTSAADGDRKVSLSGALMNNIYVLRVGSAGQSNNASNGETVDTKIISVAVTSCQALLLRAGEKVGELSLAIQGTDATFDLAQFPQIQLLGEPKPTLLNPYCPDDTAAQATTPPAAA